MLFMKHSTFQSSCSLKLVYNAACRCLDYYSFIYSGNCPSDRSAAMCPRMCSFIDRNDCNYNHMINACELLTASIKHAILMFMHSKAIRLLLNEWNEMNGSLKKHFKQSISRLKTVYLIKAD